MNRIEELRKERGWSMYDLARRVGTSAPQISKLEKEQRRLTKQWIDRIARAFGVHPGELIAPLSDDAKTLNDREKAVVELSRRMPPDQLDLWFQVGRSFVEPADDSKGNRGSEPGRKAGELRRRRA